MQTVLERFGRRMQFSPHGIEKMTAEFLAVFAEHATDDEAIEVCADVHANNGAVLASARRGTSAAAATLPSSSPFRFAEGAGDGAGGASSTVGPGQTYFSASSQQQHRRVGLLVAVAAAAAAVGGDGGFWCCFCSVQSRAAQTAAFASGLWC